jgi:thioredoxin-related protein
MESRRRVLRGVFFGVSGVTLVCLPKGAWLTIKLVCQIGLVVSRMQRALKFILCCGLLMAASVQAEVAPLKGTGQYSIPGWFKQSFLDLPEDVSSATASDKRLMVFFGQPGCPYCAALINDNFTQQPIVDFTRAHFDSIDINIWGDRDVTDFSGKTLTERQFAENLKVWFTPTVLFFDEHGKVALRINGYYPPHQFLAALKYVAEKKEHELSFTRYLAQSASPPAAGVLHDEKFFERPPYDLQRQRDKPIAVFFEQKSCPGCDELHRQVFRQTATLEQLQRYHVIRLDRWSDVPVVTPQGEKTTARQWAEQLNIAYLPTAVLFDAGKEVIRIEALLKSFHVQSVLDYVSSGAYRSQPSLQRFIRERADHLREQGTTVDLWN